ncbi:MAG: ATP-binding protein [Thermodesulfobacteriota bacterium]
MTPRKTKIADTASLPSFRPFRLVKFFSFTGLVVFLLFTLALSWLITNHAKRVLLERSEAYSLVVAENLGHQVFQQFVVPTVLRYGKIALRKPEQQEALDSVVRDATHGMRIQSVTIFDSRKNIISFSTKKELIGREGMGGIEYQRALERQSSSRLNSRGNVFNLLPGASPISSELHTYIPFIQRQATEDKAAPIMGVIEVVQDLSEDMEEIVRFQVYVGVILIVIMSGLFAVLRFIVAKAERIIENRAEERRRLEEQLHQHEKLATLGKMVASVSHEIKNPLGIVRSTAEILGKRLRSIAPGNEHLAAIIVEETGRLDGVVREFLDFARPQVPKFALASVNDVLAKVTGFIESDLENHRITLVRELDSALDPLAIDREQLYRAFLNILMNGRQAMPEGGTLTVRSRPRAGESGGVIVEVADTGVGIAPDKLTRIFTPFYTDRNRGTGLGLAIVQNIIEGHGGKIEVESEEGRGTLFRVILPRR